MKQEIHINVPTSWKDVTLKSYLNLQKDIKNYEGDNDAHFGLTLYHLCGLEWDEQKGLTMKSRNLLQEKLNGFENPTDLPLQRFITIDGVEYGFEPNLSKMSYGAYVDISQWDRLEIDDNWKKVMAILYRPITMKKSGLYTIEPYTGDEESDKWLKVPMDVHFGSLFFFINLWRDLLQGILNSSIMTEIPPNMQSILVKNGKVITQSLNLQEEIYRKWRK
jgi:hypothetical protein